MCFAGDDHDAWLGGVYRLRHLWEQKKDEEGRGQVVDLQSSRMGEGRQVQTVYTVHGHLNDLRGLPVVFGRCVLHWHNSSIGNQNVKPLYFFVQLLHESFDRFEATKVN